MPATVRTSGIPTSRKTTSAERGLPGSPISGTPSQSASSVGLPGLIASPWQTTSPSRATTVAVRSRAPTDEPAETTTTSSLGDRLGEHALERVRVVGDDPAQDRLAARLAHEPGQRRRAGVAHLTRSGLRGRRRHDLVAGRDDPDPRRREGGELGDPGRGEQPEVGRAQRAAGGRQQVARRGLLARLQHALAGSDAAQQLDVPGHRLGGVLDHHDRVGAAGQQPAGRDRHRRARSDLARRDLAHAHRAGDLQERGQRLGGRVRVGRAHRVPVDGRARPPRQRLAGRDVARRHDAERRRAPARSRCGARARAPPAPPRPS